MTTAIIPSDHDLDTAVAHLRSLNRRAFLAYAVEVGEYLVNHFFGGDFAATHDQRSTKHHSFNAFLEHRADDLAELELSGRTLRKYMAAAEVWGGLPDATRTQLGLNHLQQLAAIPDTAERKKLASDAAAMKWTREQVAVAVQQSKKERRAGKKKPGRKPKPAALKATAAVRASIRRLHEFGASLRKLGDKERSVFRDDVERAIAALQAMLAQA